MSHLSSLEMEIAIELKLTDACYRNRDMENGAYHLHKYNSLCEKRDKLKYMMGRPMPCIQDWKQGYGAKVFDPSWKSGLNALIEEPPKVSPVLLGVLSDLL